MLGKSLGFPATLLLFFLGACRSIVGIEDAELARGGAAGSGGAAGAAGGQKANAGGAGALNLCEQYCDTVLANCTGERSVYVSKIVCLDVCRNLPGGTLGATTGNSVQCRLFHARQVAIIGEPAIECPAAGPGGNGTCGENCDGYCALLSGICPRELDANCSAECESLSDLDTYNASFDAGNSVQCRLYHVSAATQDDVLHCPHAGGAAPCAP